MASTRKSKASWRALQAEKARAKQSEAAARVAEAEARKAEIAARAARDRRAGSPSERAWKLGINIGAPVLGMFAGHKVAARIGRLHTARITAQNAELTKLTKDISPLLTKAASKRATGPVVAARQQLRGIVATAAKMKLGRAAGPLGLVTAGSLLAEGYYARSVLAPQVGNATGKEALRAVGTASFFAASAVVGERLLANRTLAKMPAAGALAQIKAAEGLVGKASRSGLLGRVAGRVALPAAAAVIGLGAYQAYKAGGVKTLGKFMVGQSLDQLHPGLGRLAVSAMKAPTGAAGPSRVAQARKIIARRAATRGLTPAGTRPARSVQRAAKPKASDGRTNPYTRIQGGRRVSVKGYSTPKR